MKSIVRHIEYLLLQHDCVVIPGLGAVLCHNESARCEADGFWRAPRRVMSFNPALDRTDGLLAASVARRDGISAEAAATRVVAAVTEMRRTLISDGQLSLGFAGTLHSDASGLLSYEPSPLPWLSPMTLWLPDLELQPVDGASKIAHNAERADRRSGRLRIALRRTAVAAASVAAVAFLGWTVKTNFAGAPTEQFASLAGTPARRLIQSPGDDRTPLVLVLTPHADASIEVTEPAEVAEPNQSTAQVVNTEAESRLDPSDDYFLVVASLYKLDEAENFVKQHSSFNLGILRVGKRYRVYVASSNDTQSLLAAKKGAVAEHFPDAWVCRR